MNQKLYVLGDGLAILLPKNYTENDLLPHWVTSDTLILLYIQKGKAKGTYQGQIFPLESGHFLLGKGLVPNITDRVDFSAALFYLNTSHTFGQEEIDHSFDHLFTSESILPLEGMESWIGDVNKILANPASSFLDRMELKQQLLKLFHHILCHVLYEEEKCTCFYLQHRKNLEEAKRILEENYASPPLVSELADKLSLSPYHLQQGFKSLTGFTVYEYVKRYRFRKSIDLLLNTKMSITDIAFEVGYENPSKFSQMFKSYAHTTPLAYRKYR